MLKKANEIEAEGFKKIPWSLNYKESEFRDGLTGNFLRSKFVEGLKRVMLFGLMSNQPAGNGYNSYSVGLGISRPRSVVERKYHLLRHLRLLV